MNFVKLTHPLSCQLEVASQKLILVGLNEGSLFFAKQPAIEEHQRLLVKVPSQRSFVGSLRVDPRSEYAELVINEPKGLEHLKEWLTQLRKSQHIEICKGEVESSDRYTGFESISLMPTSLATVSRQQLDLRSDFLGRTFSTPILITGMTGGVEQGTLINQRLAEVADEQGIPMGVGSQRIALEFPEYAKIFQLKDRFPKLFLIGNLGWAQLTDSNALDLCQRAVDMIDADALAIHFNLIQELVQVEGDKNKKVDFERLHAICAKLSVPVIAKEVGCGFSPQDAKALVDCGVSAIDVGGRGGTSWSRIEGLRAEQCMTAHLGEVFRDWGIPTAYSLFLSSQAHPHLPFSATGGIRDGVTIAKACALGASLVGVGLPFMRAALESVDKVREVYRQLELELRTAMLATGSQNLAALTNRIQVGRPFEQEFFALLNKR